MEAFPKVVWQDLIFTLESPLFGNVDERLKGLHTSVGREAA